MTIDKIFQNLYSKERKKANLWLDNLRKNEINRVKETLNFLNSTDFYLGTDEKGNLLSKPDKIAVVVAGSSINCPDYRDINLFILTENSLANTAKVSNSPITKSHCRDNAPLEIFNLNNNSPEIKSQRTLFQKSTSYPSFNSLNENIFWGIIGNYVWEVKKRFNSQLPNFCSGRENKLSKYVYVMDRPNCKVFDYEFDDLNKINFRSPISRNSLIENGTGAPVTISLMYHIKEFDEPRANEKYDFIEPKNPYSGAEQIIRINKRRGSTFRVLSRQYKI